MSINIDILKENLPPEYLIPSYYYQDGQRIQIGTASADERMEDGKSSTKNAKDYVIKFYDKKQGISRAYRFIDTAGIGDTNGSEEDKVINIP